MRRRATIGAVAGAAAFAAAALLGGGTLLTLARLSVLGAALGATAVYDLSERRIPNRLILPTGVVCAALSVAGAPLSSLVFGLVLVALLLLVSLRWSQALGMGDVKLALLLVLGLDGGALRALVLGVLLAALAGLALLTRRGRTAWRTSLPLAPFLAAGALVSVFLWTVG